MTRTECYRAARHYHYQNMARQARNLKRNYKIDARAIWRLACYMAATYTFKIASKELGQ